MCVNCYKYQLKTSISDLATAMVVQWVCHTPLCGSLSYLIVIFDTVGWVAGRASAL